MLKEAGPLYPYTVILLPSFMSWSVYINLFVPMQDMLFKFNLWKKLWIISFMLNYWELLCRQAAQYNHTRPINNPCRPNLYLLGIPRILHPSPKFSNWIISWSAEATGITRLQQPLVLRLSHLLLDTRWDTTAHVVQKNLFEGVCYAKEYRIPYTASNLS